MKNIEGYGAPNKFTVGEIGDTYKDLTTGIEYECVAKYYLTYTNGVGKGDNIEYQWDEVEYELDEPDNNPDPDPPASSSGLASEIVYVTQKISSDYAYCTLDLSTTETKTGERCIATQLPNGEIILSTIGGVS